MFLDWMMSDQSVWSLAVSKKPSASSPQKWASMLSTSARASARRPARPHPPLHQCLIARALEREGGASGGVIDRTGG
jgi:hypothetical protein